MGIKLIYVSSILFYWPEIKKTFLRCYTYDMTHGGSWLRELLASVQLEESDNFELYLTFLKRYFLY